MTSSEEDSRNSMYPTIYNSPRCNKNFSPARQYAAITSTYSLYRQTSCSIFLNFYTGTSNFSQKCSKSSSIWINAAASLRSQKNMKSYVLPTDNVSFFIFTCSLLFIWPVKLRESQKVSVATNMFIYIYMFMSPLVCTQTNIGTAPRWFGNKIVTLQFLISFFY